MIGIKASVIDLVLFGLIMRIRNGRTKAMLEWW
jgi:hypothetical protein